MTPTTANYACDESRAFLPISRPLAKIRPAISVALVTEQSAERQDLEAGITQKFADVYGAQLSHFLPQLLRLRISEELGAIVGVRAANENLLFLEQYIDRPWVRTPWL